MPEDQVKVKRESSASDGMVSRSDGEHYPWGTSLSFDDEMLEELGAENLAVGDIVEIRAFAFVDHKSEHSSTDHSSKSISLQLTTVKLQRETGDRAEQLYGPNS